MKDETIAVVAGRHPHAHYGVVNTPVYRASTILFETFAEFEAAAHENPQDLIADLEAGFERLVAAA
jgi:cystathionine beta-lyase